MFRNIGGLLGGTCLGLVSRNGGGSGPVRNRPTSGGATDIIVVLKIMIHAELLSRLCHARDLLRDWEDEPISVGATARISGLTRFHFIRLFKAIFGETPHQYRSRAQVEKAKHLLVLSDLSITEVCMAVGFSSLGSFSTLFSHRVGMSPSEFQRRYRPTSLQARELPTSLIPGCLSLMAGISGTEQFSRRQPVSKADRVRGYENQ